MDQPIVLLGAAAPSILAVLILLAFGWREEMFGRRKKALERDLAAARLQQIPEGYSYIYTDLEAHAAREELAGSLFLVAIGSYGRNQLLRLLTMLEQHGLDWLVSAAVVVEHDVELRTQFQHRVPSVFRDRIIYGHSRSFGGGFSNRSIAYAMEHVDSWGKPVIAATERAITMHKARTDNHSPSEILIFWSLGGQTATGIPVLDELQREFAEEEETLLVACTDLPVHESLRENFAALKPEAEKRGVVGWIQEDELGEEPVTEDFGMIALLVGLSDTTLHTDRSPRLNNRLRLALTREPGGILIYQVVSSNLVGKPFQPHPALPPRYYVAQEPVEYQIVKNLRRLDADSGIWSADLPAGETGRSVFDLVLVSVYHDDLRDIADGVTARRTLRARFSDFGRNGTARSANTRFGQPNYETDFASLATVIDPERPICPVICIRFLVVTNGAGLIEEIVKTPQARHTPHPPIPRAGLHPNLTPDVAQPAARQEPSGAMAALRDDDDVAAEPKAAEPRKPHRRYRLRPIGPRHPRKEAQHGDAA